MKKLLITFALIFSYPLFAKQTQQERILRDKIDSRLPYRSHHCHYIKGKYTIIKSNTQYDVARGYVICELGTGELITAFEYTIEEEGSGFAVNVGDIMIAD